MHLGLSFLSGILKMAHFKNQIIDYLPRPRPRLRKFNVGSLESYFFFRIINKLPNVLVDNGTGNSMNKLREWNSH